MDGRLAGFNPRTHAQTDLWSLGVIPTLALGSPLGLLGLYWDIAWHIDLGRDSFFSAPHLLLYASMLTVLVMGLYGLVRDRRTSPYHLTRGAWSLHPGALVVAIGALVLLISAPLDDLWHRLYGADITLWGPMHLIMFTGLLVANIGGLICTAVERQLTQERQRLFEIMSLFFAGTSLAWLVALTGEYEFNVSFFLTLFHPIVLAGLTSFALVLVASLSPHRWSATIIALGFTVFRVLLALWLMMTASLGMGGYTRPMIPLLLVSAVVVDLLVAKARPAWLVGAVAGLATLLVNALLIGLQDANSWTPTILLNALVPVLVLASLAGVAGAWVATALRAPQREVTVS
jgi:hypothetical protein